MSNEIAASTPPAPTSLRPEENHGNAYHIQALLGLFPILFYVQLLVLLIVLPGALRGHADFRQLYTAGYMLRTGHAHELYSYSSQLHFQNKLVSPQAIPLPFIRPAYCALFYIPFSLLGYRTAYTAFLVLNLILLWVSYRLFRPFIRNLTALWTWLPALMFAGFYPVSAALVEGQDSILLLSIFVGAFCLLNRGKELAAGILLGLGLFKFQIVLPVALLYLFWQRWRFLGGFALSSIAAGTISLALIGPASMTHYARGLLSMNVGIASRPDEPAYPVPVHFMANLHGLVAGILGGRLSFSVHVIAIVVSAAAWLLVARLTPGNRRPIEAFPVAVVTTALVSYYIFVYDLTLLLIPIGLTLDRLAQPGARGSRGAWLTGWIAVLALLGPVSDPFIPQHRFLMSLPICALLVALVRSEVAPTWSPGPAMLPATARLES